MPYILYLISTIVISLIIWLVVIVKESKNYTKNYSSAIGLTIAIVLVMGILSIISNYVIKSSSKTEEALHFQVLNYTYYEDWDEWISQICSRTSCSGSGENEHCTTETYDCSYRSYHPETWKKIDNYGNTLNTSKEEFDEAVKLWNNKSFKDLHRDYYHDDGDAYSTEMPVKLINDPFSNKIIGYTKIGTYINKIKSMPSVFNFSKIDDSTASKMGLYTWSSNSVIGESNIKTEKLLDNSNYINAKNRELSMKIIVFNNKPIDIGLAQEAYWYGGNKNEFNVVINKINNNIDWVKIISWNTNELLEIQVRDSILAMKSFDSYKIAEYLVKTVPSKFIRRSFKEFDYIEFQVPGSIYISYFIIMIVFSIVSIVVIKITNFNNNYYKNRY